MSQTPINASTTAPGERVLLKAVGLGHADVCRMLLDRGVEVDARNDSEETSLHLAAANGHDEVVRFLIDRGADVHARNRNGFSVFYGAFRFQHKAVCESLIRAGVDINETLRDGATPLHLFARGDLVKNPRFEMAEMLVALGADIHALNKSGDTPLTIAVAFGTLDTCRMLVKLGASSSYVPAEHDKDYKTPFQQAVYRGSTKHISYFCEECGEDPAQRTVSGRTMVQLCSVYPEAKTLLQALKTSLAVQKAVGPDSSAGCPNSKKAKGMEPL